MEGIVLTQQQNADLFSLIDEYFSSTNYKTLKGFKKQTGSNIVTHTLKDDMFLLSPSVLDLPIYSDLKRFILDKVNFNIEVREIDQTEIEPPTTPEDYEI